jgi:hypothetical protein
MSTILMNHFISRDADSPDNFRNPDGIENRVLSDEFVATTR